MPVAKQRRYPLHVYIAWLFTVLVLVTGLLISAVAFINARTLVLFAVSDVFLRSSRETLAELQVAHQPIRSIVSMLAQTGSVPRNDALAEHQLFTMMQQSLEAAPLLAAIYYADLDGQMIAVQRIDYAAARRSLGAPQDTGLVLHRFSPRVGESTVSFLNERAQLIERRPSPYVSPETMKWFRAALASNDITLSSPTTLASGDVGLSVAKASGRHRSVIGGDLTLKELSASLSRQRVSPSAQLALVSSAGQVIAASHGAWVRSEGDSTDLPTLATLEFPILEKAFRGIEKFAGSRTVQHDGRDWEVMRSVYELAGGEPLYLLMAAPHDELLADVRQLAKNALLAVLVLLILAVPLTWVIARRISKSLRELAQEAQAIRHFDFEGGSTESFVLEVDNLAKAMGSMRVTIRQFLDVAAKMSAERHFQPLLDALVAQMVSAVHAGAGTVYLIDETSEVLVPSAWKGVDLERLVEPPESIFISPNSNQDLHPILNALQCKRLVSGQLPGSFPTGLGWLASRFPGHRVAFLAMPLINRGGKTIGVLFLAKSATRSDFSNEQAAFVEALSGTLASAIDNQRLTEAQKSLLDAVIRVMAGAIDAKSHHTGGHCQRVPELALMLAESACRAETGPLADFRLNADEWETLSTAAWLHDCGKLTTPEFVIDKATKLETLYDRIHEIRMRFEVLKRDVEIVYWQGLAEGGDPYALGKVRDEGLQSLDDDFAFIAQCNIGAEHQSEESVARLKEIATRTWRRTLDDRLGISNSEAERKARRLQAPLPAMEPLIADRSDHLIAHENTMSLPSDIRVMPASSRLNLGELHCLLVRQGTLTAEERALINNHIVQTIIMLRGLPFPEHLRDVPEVAGNHHEHLDGSGYPRKIDASRLSIPARIMAIADIFEALTAADRPYKRGKMLSEAVMLLADRVARGHLDRDLFERFLSDGVYRRFAERFLDEKQIDSVDIAAAILRARMSLT